MISDPPTPTKNDMILFSGVLEVACHGSRYDPDYATIQIASFAIMIRKRQFNYARIVHSPRRFGAF